MNENVTIPSEEMLLPDPKATQFSEKGKEYSEMISALATVYLADYHALPPHAALKLYRTYIREVKKEKGSKFLALDILHNEDDDSPVGIMVCCKDPFLPLTRDNLDLSCTPLLDRRQMLGAILNGQLTFKD